MYTLVGDPIIRKFAESRGLHSGFSTRVSTSSIYSTPAIILNFPIIHGPAVMLVQSF